MARALGKPKYLITDRGGEFTGGAFAKAARRLNALHRFAAKDTILATARLERFWRTLKETAGLYGFHLPLTREDLERRLELALLLPAPRRLSSAPCPRTTRPSSRHADDRGRDLLRRRSRSTTSIPVIGASPS